jgi:hypothetical protein
MDTVDVVKRKQIDVSNALKKDYEDLFSSACGKRVLKDIMLSGVMERSAFHTDALIMAASCAKQDFARHIAQMAEPKEKEVKRPKKAIK